MRSNWFRATMVAVAMISLVGCRGLGRRSGSCETCGSTEGVVVGDDWGGCTTCGKTPVFAEGGVMVDSMPGDVVAMAPPQESHALEPIPSETPMPVVVPTPRQEVTVEKKPEAKPATPMATATSPKPAAINVNLNSSVAVAAAGQEVTFDIVLENSGGLPIDSADITANFSAGLKPKSVSPAGVARIDGQRVVFEQLRNFQPMTMTYKVVAEAVAGASEGKVTVQITSPILPMGPLTEETVVRITP